MINGLLFALRCDALYALGEQAMKKRMQVLHGTYARGGASLK
jgi:hypothetical protein